MGIDLKDSYKTIEKELFNDFKEKSSKFISYAFPILTEEDAIFKIDMLWKQHPKATHVCYAYRLGLEGEKYKVNDDGEPSGTAGKPIFNQLLSADITYVLLAVVRYYGGTKLGTSGLIQAYKDGAKQVIEAATIVEKFVFDIFVLEFEYDRMGEILNIVKGLDMELAGKDFNEKPSILINLRRSQSETLIRKLKAQLLHYELERIDEETIVPFCTIKKISND